MRYVILDQKSTPSPPKITQGKMDDVELIHITPAENFSLIEKEGLIPSLSEYTIDAYLRLKEDEANADNLEFDWDEEYEKASENLPEVIFACEKEDLQTAIGMATSIYKGSSSRIKVLGIKPKFAKRFKKEQIASEIDYISTKPIPPSGLLDITDWRKNL